MQYIRCLNIYLNFVLSHRLKLEAILFQVKLTKCNEYDKLLLTEFYFSLIRLCENEHCSKRTDSPQIYGTITVVDLERVGAF